MSSKNSRKQQTIVQTHTVKKGPSLLLPTPPQAQKKNKPKKNLGKKKKLKLGGGHQGIRALSQVGQKAFTVLTNPFHEAARGGYIPDNAAQSSFKFAGKSRFVVSIPTGQRVMIFPMYSSANDTPCAFTISGTVANFNTGTYSWTTAPTGLTFSTIVNGSMPFSQQSLYDNAVSYRLVNTGFKVRYTGTVLNRGGTAIWFEDLGNYQGIADATELAGTPLGTLQSTKWTTKPNTRYCSFNVGDEHEFHATPCMGSSQNTVGFQNFNGTFSTSDSSWANTENDYTPIRFGSNTTGQLAPIPRQVLILQNTTASGTIEFTIELIGHAEYAGGNVVAMQTPSPVHLQDLHTVKSAVLQSKATHGQDPDKHPSHHAHDILGHMLQAGSQLMGMAGHEALNYVSKPSNVARLGAALGAMMV